MTDQRIDLYVEVRDEKVGIRWRRLNRCPHVIYFRIKDEVTIQVLAISHERREPGYWRERID